MFARNFAWIFYAILAVFLLVWAVFSFSWLLFLLLCAAGFLLRDFEREVLNSADVLCPIDGVVSQIEATSEGMCVAIKTTWRDASALRLPCAVENLQILRTGAAGSEELEFVLSSGLKMRIKPEPNAPKFALLDRFYDLLPGTRVGYLFAGRVEVLLPPNALLKTAVGARARACGSLARLDSGAADA